MSFTFLYHISLSSLSANPCENPVSLLVFFLKKVSPFPPLILHSFTHHILINSEFTRMITLTHSDPIDKMGLAKPVVNFMYKVMSGKLLQQHFKTTTENDLFELVNTGSSIHIKPDKVCIVTNVMCIHHCRKCMTGLTISNSISVLYGCFFIAEKCNQHTKCSCKQTIKKEGPETYAFWRGERSEGGDLFIKNIFHCFFLLLKL